MVVHDNFLFIHFPRTAGSYIHLKLIKIIGAKGLANTHGGIKDVDFNYSDKFVFTVIRNPFDWYVSEFINREYKDFGDYIFSHKGHMTKLFFDTYMIDGKIPGVNFFKYEDIKKLKWMKDEPYNVTKDKKDYKSYYDDILIKIVEEYDEYILNKFNYVFIGE